MLICVIPTHTTYTPQPYEFVLIFDTLKQEAQLRDETRIPLHGYSKISKNNNHKPTTHSRTPNYIIPTPNQPEIPQKPKKKSNFERGSLYQTPHFAERPYQHPFPKILKPPNSV